MSLTKKALSSVKTKSEIIYLTDEKMDSLMEQLRNLPDDSIELYTSFFHDSAGNKFLNSSKALPMIAGASRGPDFGMSDTYIGHGIVGGYVLTFGKQAKITAQIVSELLDGKKAEELPIETLPIEYLFDWRELQHWHIPEASLPFESVILFREPSLWESAKWIWITSLLTIAALLCRCHLPTVRPEVTQAWQGKTDAAQRPADKRRGTGAKEGGGRTSR